MTAREGRAAIDFFGEQTERLKFPYMFRIAEVNGASLRRVDCDGATLKRTKLEAKRLNDLTIR